MVFFLLRMCWFGPLSDPIKLIRTRVKTGPSTWFYLEFGLVFGGLGTEDLYGAGVVCGSEAVR